MGAISKNNGNYLCLNGIIPVIKRLCPFNGQVKFFVGVRLNRKKISEVIK